MSFEDIKATETRANITPFGESSYLIYSVELSGIESARIVYQFNAGQLSEGRFLFFANNSLNTEKAVQQYDQIKMMMTKQYGPALSDQAIHKSGDMVENYANELASDRLILKSSWQSQTSLIKHQLAWKNTRPFHQLHYQPSVSMPAPLNSDAF